MKCAAAGSSVEPGSLRSSVDEILYGRQPRSISFRIEIAEDGCREYHDQDGVLIKVQIPDGVDRNFDGHPSDGKFVRVGGPAMVYLLEQRIHRDDDLPAIETEDGRRYWYQQGRLHRDQCDQADLQEGRTSPVDDQDRPAVLDPVSGLRAWWVQGKCHRPDGPAVIRAATNPDESDRWEYWEDGFLHREFGPAVIDFDGSEEYYIRGTLFGENEYQGALKDFITRRWHAQGHTEQ